MKTHQNFYTTAKLVESQTKKQRKKALSPTGQKKSALGASQTLRS